MLFGTIPHVQVPDRSHCKSERAANKKRQPPTEMPRYPADHQGSRKTTRTNSCEENTCSKSPFLVAEPIRHHLVADGHGCGFAGAHKKPDARKGPGWSHKAKQRDVRSNSSSSGKD